MHAEFDEVKTLSDLLEGVNCVFLLMKVFQNKRFELTLV